MATFVLQVLPTSRGDTPSASQLAIARDQLLTYISYIDYEVEARVFSKPTLVDTGAAFEEMNCPLCNSTLDRYGDDDHNEWWYEMETKIAESRTPLTESLTMPCCKMETRAEALKFGKDAIFVNWMLRVNDYELHSGRMELDVEHLTVIGDIVGCEVSQLICVKG